MNKEYLPIGSVVLLKNSKKRLMITGFYVKPNNSDTYFDYLGCIFPEGMISEQDNYIFNNEQIEEVCFKGLVDEEETNFKSKLYEIIGAKKDKKEDKIISIPVSLYKEYGTQENDIISVPIDKYNEAVKKDVISIPANLYKEFSGAEAESSNVISIPSKLYKKYSEKETGASIISVPLSEYNKEKGIINVPLSEYKKYSDVITIPIEEYQRLSNNNIIKINAKTYEQFLQDEKIISIPADVYEKERMIRIPLSVYERLQKKEEVISVPLNAYERLINENGNKVISIPISEYRKLTGGNEENGVITLPAKVYDEILRKEKSNIEEKREIIEIPYDLYKKAQLED